jgi:hypothetical protein
VFGPQELRERFLAIFSSSGTPGVVDALFVEMALLVPSPPKRAALLGLATNVSWRCWGVRTLNGLDGCAGLAWGTERSLQVYNMPVHAIVMTMQC